MLNKKDKIIRQERIRLWRIILSIAAIILIAVIFLLIKSGLIGNPFKKQPEPPVEIGAILPFEGANAAKGEALKKAALLALEEVNGKAVKGGDFQIFWENGGCNETKAAVAAENLIVRKHLKFILGGYCNSETEGLAAAVLKNQVIAISPNSDDVFADNDFIFSLAPRKNVSADAVARYAREELKSERAVIITAISSYTTDISNIFEASFKSYGGEVVFRENFSILNEDMAGTISRLKNENFDVVFMAVEIPAIAARYIAALREAGIEAPVILPEMTLTENSVKEYANLNGAMAVLPNVLNANSLEDFKNKYKAYYNEEAAYPEEQARMYSAVNLFADVFQKYEFDTVKIKDYLSKLKNWPSALGNLSFGEGGYALYSYRALKAENGALQEMKIYKP